MGVCNLRSYNKNRYKLKTNTIRTDFLINEGNVQLRLKAIRPVYFEN